MMEHIHNIIIQYYVHVCVCGVDVRLHHKLQVCMCMCVVDWLCHCVC